MSESALGSTYFLDQDKADNFVESCSSTEEKETTLVCIAVIFLETYSHDHTLID